MNKSVKMWGRRASFGVAAAVVPPDELDEHALEAGASALHPLTSARRPHTRAKPQSRTHSHAHGWAQAPALGAIVELDMEALSWGAAALEKAFLGALVNLFAGGTAPSAFLDAYAPSECC